MKPIQLEIRIPEDFTLFRLDQAVAKLFPEYSRSRLQQWIKSGALTVNGNAARAKEGKTELRPLGVSHTGCQWGRLGEIGREVEDQTVCPTAQRVIAQKPGGEHRRL